MLRSIPSIIAVFSALLLGSAVSEAATVPISTAVPAAVVEPVATIDPALTETMEICIEEEVTSVAVQDYSSNGTTATSVTKTCKKVPKYCNSMVVVEKGDSHRDPSSACNAKCSKCPKRDGERMWCHWDARFNGYTCQYDGE